MKCQRCGADTPPDEIMEYASQSLCEDCYMDALSPARSCDPWSTYSASRLVDQTLTPLQEKIMALITEKDRISPEELMAAAGLDEGQLKREIASLRHMELIRGEPAGEGKVVFRPFNSQ